MRQNIIKTINSIMQKIDSFSDWCLYAGAFLMLVLPIIMAYEVVMRYFFNRPTSWAVDLSEFILLFSTFFTAGWLLREREHISMVFIMEHLNERNRLILEVIQSLIGSFACGFLLWSGFVTTWYDLKKWTMLVSGFRIPKFAILWVIPFGVLMLLIYFVRGFFKSMATLRASYSKTTVKVDGENRNSIEDQEFDK